MFGMFVHGGVVGKTQVTQRFPWLTKLLAKVIQLSPNIPLRRLPYPATRPLSPIVTVTTPGFFPTW